MYHCVTHYDPDTTIVHHYVTQCDIYDDDGDDDDGDNELYNY